MAESRRDKIKSIMGTWYGMKYRIAYYLHLHIFISFLHKKELKIKLWGKYVIYLRLFSRDLDFFESIFVGQYNGTEFVGEYDIKDIDCEDFLDLGANVGLFAFLYAVRFPEKRIIAIEPEENNYNQLSKNVAQFPNVITVLGGVWYRNHKVKVYPSRVAIHDGKSFSDGAFYIGECSEDDGAATYAFSIEALVNKYRLKKYMVKMDIEGAEYEIFKYGNLKWIEQCSILAIETHGWLLPDKGIDEIVVNYMTENGCSMEVLGENKIFKKCI